MSRSSPRPAGERAHAVRHPAVSPVTTSTSSNRTPSSSATSCARTPSRALALGGQPGGDLDLAGRLDVHVGALVGPDAGALDVAGQADADPAPWPAISCW